MPPWWELGSHLTALMYAWVVMDGAAGAVPDHAIGQTVRVLGILAAVWVVKRVAVLLVVRFVPMPAAKNVMPAELLADGDGRFVEVDGVRVHHMADGQDGPAVVLLHGLGGSTHSWRQVAPALRATHTVVAYDRPGWGLTERPDPGAFDGANPYSREAQEPLLIGLMDALGIERAVLVGHSAGGAIALEAALAHPERVQALVLVGPAVYRQVSVPRWLLPVLRTETARRIGPVIARVVKPLGRWLAKVAWADPAKLTPEVLEGYLRPFRVEGWDRALWELVVTTTSHDLAERVAEVTVPTLVVTGAQDRVVPPVQCERLVEELPNAALAVIEAAGHVPHQEQPEAFVEAVRGFLEECETARPANLDSEPACVID